MAQELFSYSCESCNTHICTYSNEWVEISETYSTYENPQNYAEVGLERVKLDRAGSKDSELERCTLRPLRCKRCQTGLGLLCVRAPEEKKRYQ